MDLELWQLRYFLAVAEDLGFGTAAKRLNVSQPAVSRAIIALEDELGTPLFKRNRRRVDLTEAGAAMRDEASRLLEQARRALETVRAVAQGKAGCLAIAFESSVAHAIVPEAIAAYRKRYTDVHISLTELPTPKQIDCVRRGEIQVAFAVGAIRDVDLGIVPILRERVVAAIPQSHPLSAAPRIRLGDLADEPFITSSRHTRCGFYSRIICLCQGAGFTPNTVTDVNDTDLMLGLVAAGQGVSLVPASVAARGRAGAVFVEVEPPMFVDLSLIHARDGVLITTQRFIEATYDVSASMSGQTYK
jgi:DNA-binding transcriptional LysR family regulator